MMDFRIRGLVFVGLLSGLFGGRDVVGDAQYTNGLAGMAILRAAVAVPTLDIPSDPGSWARRRDEIRSNLWQSLGDLPPRSKASTVRVVEAHDRGDWTEERFEFDNSAGSRVPGVLLLPKKRSGKIPGILYCHWHGGEYDGGKSELFQARHTPLEPGPELVRRGYAVVAIDAPCFGERQGRGPDGLKGSAGELSASKLELWLGRSLWGMMLRDDLIALDYLCSRPEVDASRIGATGISMGATRTWWLMALDDRIRSGVAVACLTRYQDLIAAGGLKYHGIYYYVAGLLRHFDTEAVVACVAPRSLLCLNGDQDVGSPISGIRTIERLVAPAWDATGAPGEFRSVVYPGVGHAYTPEMWSEMLGWFRRTLGGR
ncbi:MAG: dienelactone hydrolase [Verrucomicrobia bacterium]|nr:dienelactone hydrolase [Verrucomicrobiota bacterium]